MSFQDTIARKLTGMYILYASTIFLSAFLIFVVQPIAGKHLLPYFGGSSSVWATSMLFFTTVLFLGYSYVYVLTSLDNRRQGVIHICVVAFVALITLTTLYVYHSLGISSGWIIGSVQSPSLKVLIMLTLVIGAPYLLLSTTGPLLQYWWGITTRAEPYKFYALSNIGSLLALFSYPFVIEPSFSLMLGGWMWALLFFVFVILTGIVCTMYVRHVSQIGYNNADASDDISPRISYSTRVWWIVLAAFPSYMLVATTTVLTNVVAPVPLLWVFPLAIYLVTFILAFRGFGQSIFMPPVLILVAYLAYEYSSTSSVWIFGHIGSYALLLFVCGLMCHALLYEARPSLQKLPLFYLLLSFGGMLGALTASILAPSMFSGFYEFPLGIALCASLGIIVMKKEFFPRILDDKKIIITKIVFIVCVTALFVSYISKDGGHKVVASRNFYGSVVVQFKDDVTVLMHGYTLHGFQPTAKEWRHVPASYYVPSSGVGRALLYVQKARKNKDIRVGVLGLGTAAIASYCRHGDTFVFYEIDERIEMIARKYFSYLSYCESSQVRIGDGRLLMESELLNGQSGSYDLVVMDAFSDDTVPAHLLTLQAIKLYVARLRSPESIIAIHVSNRYLNLSPVMFRIASELGLSATTVLDNASTNELGKPSLWVLLSKNPKVFDNIVFAGANSKDIDIRNTPLWTDDYTSLFSVVNIPLSWK